MSPSEQSIAPSLTPTQHAAFESLERQLVAHGVAVLSARPSMGKTRILRALFCRTGGVYLTSRELVEASTQRHPLALDETIYSVLRQALDANDTVIVDDFQFVSLVACCVPAYPRQNLLAAALLPLTTFARDRGKRLVFTAEGMPLMGLHERFPMVPVGAFTETDYAAICASYLADEAARRIDYGKVHRFAPSREIAGRLPGVPCCRSSTPGASAARGFAHPVFILATSVCQDPTHSAVRVDRADARRHRSCVRLLRSAPRHRAQSAPC